MRCIYGRPINIRTLCDAYLVYLVFSVYKVHTVGLSAVISQKFTKYKSEIISLWLSSYRCKTSRDSTYLTDVSINDVSDQNTFPLKPNFHHRTTLGLIHCTLHTACNVPQKSDRMQISCALHALFVCYLGQIKWGRNATSDLKCSYNLFVWIMNIYHYIGL